MSRLIESSALAARTVVAMALVLTLSTHRARGDGGALVARGPLANGDAAAVFLSPVPPRAGTVTIEAVATSWRRTPPRVTLERDGRILSAITSPSPIDPLAAFVEIDVPEPGLWRLVVESDAGRLETEIPIAPEPPPWRSRLPWMLAWIPVCVLWWARSNAGRSRRPPAS